MIDKKLLDICLANNITVCITPGVDANGKSIIIRVSKGMRNIASAFYPEDFEIYSGGIQGGINLTLEYMIKQILQQDAEFTSD